MWIQLAQRLPHNRRRERRFAVPWEQFTDPMDWMVGNPLEDMFEIGFGIEPVEPSFSYETINSSCPIATANGLPSEMRAPLDPDYRNGITIADPTASRAPRVSSPA
jgi:hypothetical protein